MSTLAPAPSAALRYQLIAELKDLANLHLLKSSNDHFLPQHPAQTP
jgi:hypothetical protein